MNSLIYAEFLFTWGMAIIVSVAATCVLSMLIAIALDALKGIFKRLMD